MSAAAKRRALLARLARVAEDLESAPGRAESARKVRGEVVAYEAGMLGAICREEAAVIRALLAAYQDENRNQTKARAARTEA